MSLPGLREEFEEIGKTLIKSTNGITNFNEGIDLSRVYTNKSNKIVYNFVLQIIVQDGSNAVFFNEISIVNSVPREYRKYLKESDIIREIKQVIQPGDWWRIVNEAIFNVESTMEIDNCKCGRIILGESYKEWKSSKLELRRMCNNCRWTSKKLGECPICMDEMTDNPYWTYKTPCCGRHVDIKCWKKIENGQCFNCRAVIATQNDSDDESETQSENS